MFQYLNRATEDFERGSRLLAVGDTAEANVAFDNAEQNLLLVQQFFPFNKDARVLTIKIAQQRDPQGFVELFRKDFIDARDKIATSPQEAYVELKDLEALEPRYPGLQAAIEEAEYATGIKVRPPDPAKIARADELYQRALQIVNNNIRTEFPVALAFLDEALSLNPNSQAAIRLKDTVAISMGGTTTTVLSSADQQRYAEAVAEFTAGNYLRAQIIVDILLENPDNRNNTRLLELKERIQSAQ
jgi:tetratricopeptide (TPR) repeat protein